MDMTSTSIVLLIVGFLSAFGVSRLITRQMKRMRQDKSAGSEYERLYGELQELPRLCLAIATEQVTLARQVMDKIAERRVIVNKVYEEYRRLVRQHIREYGDLASQWPTSDSRGKERIERQSPRFKEVERHLLVREKAAVDLLKKHGSVWASALSEWEKARRDWAALDRDAGPGTPGDRRGPSSISAEHHRRLAQRVRELSERRSKETQLAGKHERMRTQLMQSWVEDDKKIDDEKETHRRELERNRLTSNAGGRN